MRTSEEAHIYMDHRPCTCGDIEFARQSAVMTDDGVLCSRYFGSCRTCSTLREFIFELPELQRPARNQVEFGGDDPSRLLDAGEWMAISEYYAKLQPGTPDDLDIARAALEEVIKFIPSGVASVPDAGFWAERGRAVRDREPGRFHRDRLSAVLAVYLELLAKQDLTQTPLVWKHTGDAEFPFTVEARGQRFTVRVNDFPAEPMYTMMARGIELYDLEDWPPAWVMPDPLAPKFVGAQGSMLQRLAAILEERGARLLPLLRAVEAAREPKLYLEVSALSRKLSVLLPYRPDVLAALAPAPPVGDLPVRPMLKVFVDGDHLDVAISAVGRVEPDEAVDVAPAAARAAWIDLVSALHGPAGARISSRTRFLTRQRSTIDVFYEARAQCDDAHLAESLDQIAGRLGVEQSQRDLWKSVHPSLGGAAVTITTACAEGGPAPELAFMYGKAEWNEAVRLCQLVASEAAARAGAAVLGMLAGTLRAEQMMAVHLALKAEGPDVAALVMLK